MPQTLAALPALVLSSFLIFNLQRLTIRSQTQMSSAEIDLAASALAVEVLEFVAARSFDERTTPRGIYLAGRMPSGESEFSAPEVFGPTDRGLAGCNLLSPVVTPDCDDVDDLDSLAWTPVRLDLAHGRSLPFQVRTHVVYVPDTLSSSSAATARTRHKRVTVELRAPRLGNLRAAGKDVLTATRVVSYDPIKAEMDYERVYGAIGT